MHAYERYVIQYLFIIYVESKYKMRRFFTYHSLIMDLKKLQAHVSEHFDKEILPTLKGNPIR